MFMRNYERISGSATPYKMTHWAVIPIYFLLLNLKEKVCLYVWRALEAHICTKPLRALIIEAMHFSSL